MPQRAYNQHSCKAFPGATLDTPAHGESMAHWQSRLRGWLAAGGTACALLLAGCADGLDLNGKVFDMMGISSSALDAKRVEPKLAERAPLVVPPDVNRLPEPGSGQAPSVAALTMQPTAAGAQAWPDDPEERKRREAAERERLHQAYCRGEIDWKERALNKERVSAPKSPYGPCPSLFGVVTDNINKE